MKESTVKAEFKKPVVAVSTKKKTINNLIQQNDGPYFKIKKLVQVNRIAKTTLYLFSFQDVDLDHYLIKGVYYNTADEKWEQKNFPFPDVLYDRVRGNLLQKNQSDLVRSKFKEMGIKNINPLNYFNKWELYQLLEKSKVFRPHLPPTRLLESTDDLKFMMDKSRCIYLKTCRGSRGKQVMSITKLPNDRYKYRFYSTNIVVGKVKNLHALFRVIHAFFQGRKIIIQQAIDLLTVNNCIIDIRGELQRNGKGKLEVIGTPVRVGKKDSPITTRSVSYPFEEFFRKYFHLTGEKIISLKNDVDQFLIAVYKYVEQSYGPFGEIGIDIGLDKKGGIWFIECNAKSAKVSICNTANEETIKKLFLNPLEYARHISRNQEITWPRQH